MNNYLKILFVFLLFSCNSPKEKREFYPTGELQNRYLPSHADGLDTILEYYRTGELKMLRTDIADRDFLHNHGFYEEYDKEGRLQWILFYLNDKEIGRNERFGDNDKIYVDINDSLQNKLFASYYSNGRLLYVATPDTNVGQDGQPIIPEFVDSLYFDALSKVDVEWDEGHQLGDKIIDTTWRKRYKLKN